MALKRVRKGIIHAKSLPDVVEGKLIASPAPIDLRVQNAGALGVVPPSLWALSSFMI